MLLDLFDASRDAVLQLQSSTDIPFKCGRIRVITSIRSSTDLVRSSESRYRQSEAR